MTLYSFKNQYPAPLPFRIRLNNGMTKTDPSTFTTQDISDAGYVQVEDAPIPNSNQVVFWSFGEGQWVIRDKTATEIAAENETLRKNIIDSTQKRLDAFAHTRNYDSMLSACTYATSTILKFKTEGQYCVEARDSTWIKLYEILEQIQAGSRPMPNSFEDIEPELPVLEWPN